jgi:hypothetical protein
VNATSDRLSRWTPAMFALAVVNLVLGLLLSVLGLAWPAVAPVSLAMAHLLTIGWLTLLMFGALFQFVPVITSRKLPSQALPLATLIGVECGLALMVGGFPFPHYSMPGRSPPMTQATPTPDGNSELRAGGESLPRIMQAIAPPAPVGYGSRCVLTEDLFVKSRLLPVRVM